MDGYRKQEVSKQVVSYIDQLLTDANECIKNFEVKFVTKKRWFGECKQLVANEAEYDLAKGVFCHISFHGDLMGAYKYQWLLDTEKLRGLIGNHSSVYLDAEMAALYDRLESKL